MRARGANYLIPGLLACCVLFLSLPTISSPADRWLHDLVESSDLIAIADVVAVLPAPVGASAPASDSRAGIPLVARLAPLRIWKGEDQVTIDVPFTRCLAWPPGPAYVEGSRVIVFLRTTPDGWATLDLARVPADSTGDHLESLDPSQLGHGPGAVCLPGLPDQGTGTIIP